MLISPIGSSSFNPLPHVKFAHSRCKTEFAQQSFSNKPSCNLIGQYCYPKINYRKYDNLKQSAQLKEAADCFSFGAHNLVSPTFFDDFLEIPLRSQSSASGALLLPASSVRLPAFSRPEFRSSSPKNWGSPFQGATQKFRSRSLSRNFLGQSKNLEDKISIIPSIYQTGLEQNIESNLGVKPAQTEIKKFKNGETYINIEEDVRGKDVYLMPAGGENVNDNLMETYLKADAAKRAGAQKVVAIMPNFDYARQERRVKAGEPISAKLNMDLLKTSGVDEVITTDLHAQAIEGFASNDFKITQLESLPVMKEYIKNKNIPDLIVVSPDLGGTKRAENLAAELNCEKAIIHKHRYKHNEACAENIIGDVNGKNCIIYDDIIDTAGTICAAAQMLKDCGAKDIYVCASHGLFNGSAQERLQNAPIKEVIVTNSVQPKSNPIDKIKQVDISAQISDTIRKISS
ncbi:MAG: ribose-phosphate pyrophosphokinase [Candidatus Gastranaerophilales bacterium]|nr:ribose-phosphate pyrophosphokinase [Candidatus Gastranaerophilales bacterium]